MYYIHNVNNNIYFYYKNNFSGAPTAKINGQTTPLDVTSLSQNEIQGLLLGSHPSQQQQQQNINVKREPEDLRKDPKCTRGQKVSLFVFLCSFFFYTL